MRWRNTRPEKKTLKMHENQVVLTIVAISAIAWLIPTDISLTKMEKTLWRQFAGTWQFGHMIASPEKLIGILWL